MSAHPERWPEHDYVAQWVPSKGYRYVADKLGKKYATVWAYAKRHGIEYGDIPGHVRVPIAAAVLDLTPTHLWAKAKSEGVLKTLGPMVGPWRKRKLVAPRARAAVVPHWWVDQQQNRLQNLRRGDELKDAGWITTRQAANMWTVGFGTVQRALNGQGALARVLQAHSVRTARCYGTHAAGNWLINPHDAEAVRRYLEDGRRRAKELVSVKSIYVETGATPGTAAHHAKTFGCFELIFTHGRLMGFVTPQAAKQLRARLQEATQ